MFVVWYVMCDVCVVVFDDGIVCVVIVDDCGLMFECVVCGIGVCLWVFCVGDGAFAFVGDGDASTTMFDD